MAIKKMFYPVFTVNGGLDFEENFGDGRFITSFVEDKWVDVGGMGRRKETLDLELDGIRNATKFESELNNQLRSSKLSGLKSKVIRKLEEDLLNFIITQTPNDEKVESITLEKVGFIYSDKIFCYRCGCYYYEDDYCGNH